MEGDDRDLVQKCLTGDQAACASLANAYARMVGTVILRATGNSNAIEDLTQEVFLRIFRALPYFDGRAKLSTWIYTIAHRVAIDHLRQAGRWREESLGVGEDEEPGARRLDGLHAPKAIDPEALMMREESQRLVREGLTRLPEKYRLPLEYAAIDGLDHATIAEMIGVTPATVKMLVFRAKRMLKETIDTTLALRTAGHEVSDAL